MKTYSPKPQDIERRWYVIDASGAVLGRLASEVAAILRGKHKPIFAPHADTGDHVIVVNARGVQLTGGKEAKKFAYRHSGYPGGLTAIQYTRLLSERPERAVEKAIKGMLPKNRLGRAMARKLQVYPGAEHPHAAQRPRPLRLGEVPPWSGLPEPRGKSPRDEVAAVEDTSHGAAAAAEAPMARTAKRTTAAKRTAASKETTARASAATAKTTATKQTTAKKTSAAKKTTAATKASAAGKATTSARRTKKEA